MAHCLENSDLFLCHIAIWGSLAIILVQPSRVLCANALTVGRMIAHFHPKDKTTFRIFFVRVFSPKTPNTFHEFMTFEPSFCGRQKQVSLQMKVVQFDSYGKLGMVATSSGYSENFFLYVNLSPAKYLYCSGLHTQARPVKLRGRVQGTTFYCFDDTLHSSAPGLCFTTTYAPCGGISCWSHSIGGVEVGFCYEQRLYYSIHSLDPLQSIFASHTVLRFTASV